MHHARGSLRESRFLRDTAGRLKLLCVANRLPSTAIHDDMGNWSLKKSTGGLASALSAVENLHMTQIGWPGAEVPAETRPDITKELREHLCIPVYLAHEQIEQYYNGFSNGVLWPLFHYVTPALITGSHDSEWTAYETVNQVFAQAIADELIAEGDEDTLVWIHDYHLMLVPKFLRQLVPKANIGFFLHTPFPSVELFRMLPYREQVLQGLLSADFIGFQTRDYCRHFLSACSQLTNLQVTSSCVDAVPIGGALVSCACVPIGIDPEPFISATTEDEIVVEKVFDLREQFGVDRKIILGVDRLDYMKGIQHKLQAFEKFLDTHPEWVGNCVLVQLAVPSRGDVKEYQRLRKHVHEQVGQLCGKHSHLTSGPPVLYLDQAIDFQGLVALYRAADVMLITSIRDGMNLVAFEYVASQRDTHGVLVLSEFTGAMMSMGGGALRVNPWNLDETSAGISRALTMSDEERRSRHQFCFEYVTTYTAQKWAETFIENLKNAVTESAALTASIPPPLPVDELVAAWETPSESRPLLVLDLVDCLVSPMTSSGRPLVSHPEFGSLSFDVRKSLERLIDADLGILVSTAHRRDLMDSLFSWLGDRVCRVVLVAENGCVFKAFTDGGSRQWQPVVGESESSSFANPEWRHSVRKLVEFLQERTPGSFIEESDLSLKWFTSAAPADGANMSILRELLLQRWAGPLTENEAEVVLADRYVEIRPRNACLGLNIAKILEHPEAFPLVRDEASVCVMAAAFPYRDDETYQIIEEKLKTLWVHRCGAASAFSLFRSLSQPGVATPVSRATSTLSQMMSPVSSRSLGELEESWSTYTPSAAAEVDQTVPPALQEPPVSSCQFFTITVSHAKISKARYSLTGRNQLSNLLIALADRTPGSLAEDRSRGA